MNNMLWTRTYLLWLLYRLSFFFDESLKPIQSFILTLNLSFKNEHYAMNKYIFTVTILSTFIFFDESLKPIQSKQKCLRFHSEHILEKLHSCSYWLNMKICLTNIHKCIYFLGIGFFLLMISQVICMFWNVRLLNFNLPCKVCQVL